MLRYPGSITLSIVPFIIGATYYKMMIQSNFEDSTKKANAQCGEITGETIKVRTVTILNRQKYFEDNCAKQKTTSLNKKKSHSFIYWVCSFESITDLGGISMMVLVVASEQLGYCSTFAKSFTKAKISTLSIFQVIDRKPNIDFGMEGKEPPVGSLDGKIRFKDIVFHYPARPNHEIFSGDFHLQGKACITIALVGPSGCDKSVTIGMLQRWYDTSQGQVSLDKKNVKSFTLHNLRAHMALVGHEPILFDMSIRENVEFVIDKDFHGSNITLEQIEETCKSANTHFRKPTILLLDEATSALDCDSEKVVQAALDNIIEKNNRTTITVTHTFHYPKC